MVKPNPDAPQPTRLTQPRTVRPPDAAFLWCEPSFDAPVDEAPPRPTLAGQSKRKM